MKKIAKVEKIAKKYFVTMLSTQKKRKFILLFQNTTLAIWILQQALQERSDEKDMMTKLVIQSPINFTNRDNV